MWQQVSFIMKNLVSIAVALLSFVMIDNVNAFNNSQDFPNENQGKRIKIANTYTPSKLISSLNLEEMHIAQRKTVFRTTQRLKARDGRQIYLYSSGKCKLWDGDILVASTTYKLIDGEVMLLDEYGDIVCKGSYTLSRDRQNLASLTISGTTYYKK